VLNLVVLTFEGRNGIVISWVLGDHIGIACLVSNIKEIWRKIEKIDPEFLW